VSTILFEMSLFVNTVMQKASICRQSTFEPSPKALAAGFAALFSASFCAYIHGAGASRLWR